MTTPEKIEGLLQRFGETLSDLPIPDLDDNDSVYSRKELGDAFTRATQWHKRKSGTYNTFDCEDFICHQSDVIEKLVMALESAVKEILMNTCKEE